ncbi:hypothetical protein LX36DRAFT_260202 [Colletotrichum falcatum]|nr:hypothetical protein LX36DRAFT_260202 [Colletotrichum falcatum]
MRCAGGGEGRHSAAHQYSSRRSTDWRAAKGNQSCTEASRFASGGARFGQSTMAATGWSCVVHLLLVPFTVRLGRHCRKRTEAASKQGIERVIRHAACLVPKLSSLVPASFNDEPAFDDSC